MKYFHEIRLLWHLNFIAYVSQQQKNIASILEILYVNQKVEQQKDQQDQKVSG